MSCAKVTRSPNPLCPARDSLSFAFGVSSPGTSGRTGHENDNGLQLSQRMVFAEFLVLQFRDLSTFRIETLWTAEPVDTLLFGSYAPFSFIFIIHGLGTKGNQLLLEL